MKVQYDDYIATETTWSTLSDLIQSQLGMTATTFENYYWADCFLDEDELAVPTEDAPYVIPYAYNYNSEGGYENNWYDMLVFNFSNDIYGNGGTPPVSGEEGEETEPEWDYVSVAAYAPNKEKTGNHVISFETWDEIIETLVAGQTSPVTFTRWVRFVAKPNAEGKVEAPYRYIWVKLSMEISWGGDNPDGISTVGTDKPTGYYYNLSGQKMKRPNSLRKGVYIRDGKKIVVK